MRLPARKSLISCDRGDHWCPTSLSPFASGEILGLPVVEQIVDHREEAFLGRIPRLREVVIEMRLVDGLDGRVDVRVGREHHATRQRVDLAGLREHLSPLDARHPLVADHDGQRVASGLQFADGGERLFARGRADDRVGLPVPRAEIAAHRREHLRIVVNDKEDGLVHGASPGAVDLGERKGDPKLCSPRSASRRRSRRRCG